MLYRVENIAAKVFQPLMQLVHAGVRVSNLVIKRSAFFRGSLAQ